MLSNVQAGEPDYPKPVRDILAAAGVLDALPFDPEPVLAGGSGVSLPRPLSHEWSNEGASGTASLSSSFMMSTCSWRSRYRN